MTKLERIADQHKAAIDQLGKAEAKRDQALDALVKAEGKRRLALKAMQRTYKRLLAERAADRASRRGPKTPDPHDAPSPLIV